MRWRYTSKVMGVGEYIKTLAKLARRRRGSCCVQCNQPVEKHLLRGVRPSERPDYRLHCPDGSGRLLETVNR